MMELDLQTVLATVSGGSATAIVLWIVKRLAKSGIRVGVFAERVEVEELKAAAKSGREAKARYEALAREAEVRVARAEALAAQCRRHAEQATHERDELALRIAKGGADET